MRACTRVCVLKSTRVPVLGKTKVTIAPRGSRWKRPFEDSEKSVVGGELGEKTRMQNSGKLVFPGLAWCGDSEGLGPPPPSGWAVGKGPPGSQRFLPPQPQAVLRQ